MFDIRIRIDDADAREAFRRAPAVMQSAVDAKLSRGAQEVVREARSLAPKAFSTLTNSIKASQEGLLRYVVAPGVNYARSVEEGVRPGTLPPVAALVPWVKRVLGASDKEARGKAFLIARAIKRRGIRTQKYMAPAAEKMESRLIQLVRQGVDQGVREVFGA